MLAFDGIVSFSNKPLKMIGTIGILSVLLSFAVFVYAVLSYMFKWNNLVPGWSSIIICIAFFSGVQLISIWIMSEYISRIYDETRNRPEYIIDKKINLN